jgi:hypothetical protein
VVRVTRVRLVLPILVAPDQVTTSKEGSQRECKYDRRESVVTAPVIARLQCGVINDDRPQGGFPRSGEALARYRVSNLVFGDLAKTLLDGKSLRRICSDAGIPSWATVFRWIACHKEFAKSTGRGNLSCASLCRRGAI